jgi:hypothetical protein
MAAAVQSSCSPTNTVGEMYSLTVTDCHRSALVDRADTRR